MRFTGAGTGIERAVATMRIQPRDTPEERADGLVEVELDEALAVYADQLEEWAAPLEHWTLTFRQGHDFDRADNVEARLLFTGGGHTCSVAFRLDQIDSATQFERELWLTLDARDGIAKGVHLAPLGLDVELHHIVGPAFGDAAT